MFSEKYLTTASIIILLFLSTLQVSETTITDSDHLHRSRRQLLFPNSTLLQFNAGIGVPSPADYVNFNWAFQANFQLPWNRTQIPMDLLNANDGYGGDSRKKRNNDDMGGEIDGDYESDAHLYHLYKYVEEVFNSFGYNGSACVLQTLCQIGAEPLHSDDEEDLLHEITRYVLNPINDARGRDLTEKSAAFSYIKAYKQGQKNEDCIKIYDSCTIAPVDMFSKLHDVDKLFM